MPFPWAAVIGAVTGIGSSVINSNSKKDAADAQNEEAEKRAEAQYERAEKEWEISYYNDVANWMWDVAETEAARYIDRQKKADYEWRQGKLIDSALKNLDVNQQAIFDKFGREENLRGRQERMKLSYTMSGLAADSRETLRQYMTDIQAKSLESQALVQSKDTEGQALQIDVTNGMAEESVKRSIDTVAAVVGSSVDRAKAVTRSGGSSSGTRQSLNALQELGRTYGQMAIRNRSRKTRVDVFNSSMQGEVATQMGSYALSMMDNVQRMKYTSDKYARDGKYNLDVFKNLTMPSFEMASRQGQRELYSLYIQTEGKINEASMPYRESIIFDPIEPIKGLKPEYYAPTKVYEPTGLDVALGAIQGGVQGAMQFSYQKDGGGLGFF